MIKKVTGMLKNKIVLAFLFTLFMGKSVVANADSTKGRIAYENGDYQTAFAEFMLLAEKGDATAQYTVGYMYNFGIGVPENDKTAVKWYTKAAEQGEAGAQFNLGNMYKNGHGVLENDKTAVKWYTKAAEQGFAQSQNNLGVMYEYGNGVLTDYVRAYMWYNLGAFNGNTTGDIFKSSISEKMTSSDISKAQEMSGRCLESGYTDC